MLPNNWFQWYPAVGAIVAQQRFPLLPRIQRTFNWYTVSTGVCRTYSPVANGAHLQLARLAPVGNSLAYVLNNDIYYRSSGRAGTPEQRVTFNGEPGIFYNGVPDWVYEGNFFIKLQWYLLTMSASYSGDRRFNSRLHCSLFWVRILG